jgi:hypothetical protein
MSVRDLTGRAPDKPHLALMTGEGAFIAMPVGCTMAEIIDPTDSRGITPLLLVEVKPGKWTFRCKCNPECTMVYTFKATGTGSHRGNPNKQFGKRKR